jgi:hypothetical protein
MTNFPDIQLDEPFIAQKEYSSNIVDVVQIDDNVSMKRLAVFCQLGSNPSFKYYITVMSGDAYTVNWTNEDITNAVKAFFASNSGA